MNILFFAFAHHSLEKLHQILHHKALFGAELYGDAALLHREAIERAGGRAEISREKTFPSAVAVGRLAMKALARKKGSARPILTPLYLYPKDCNVTLPKKTHA